MADERDHIICRPVAGADWPPDQLVRAILDGNSTLFFGSGISYGLSIAASGQIGDWDWFKRSLLHGTRFAQLPRSAQNYLIGRYDLEILEYFLNQHPGWRTRLSRMFTLSQRSAQPLWTTDCPPVQSASGTLTSDYFDIIERLCMEFASVVTTNYDNLVGPSGIASYGARGAVHMGMAPSMPTPGTIPHPSLVYLHGSVLNNQDECVVTSTDYDSVYGETGNPVPTFLKDLFSRSSVLFAGFSLSDPDIKRILRMARGIASPSVKHFALLFVPDIPGDPWDSGWEGHELEALASSHWNLDIYWLCRRSPGEIPPRTYSMLVAFKQLIERLEKEQAVVGAGQAQFPKIDRLAEEEP